MSWDCYDCYYGCYYNLSGLALICALAPTTPGLQAWQSSSLAPRSGRVRHGLSRTPSGSDVRVEART